MKTAIMSIHIYYRGSELALLSAVDPIPPGSGGESTAQPEAESNVTVKASCYNLAPAKGDPGFISSRTCAGVEGRAEGGVLFSLHVQTAMKGTPYVHAFRLYAKSP